MIKDLKTERLEDKKKIDPNLKYTRPIDPNNPNNKRVLIKKKSFSLQGLQDGVAERIIEKSLVDGKPAKSSSLSIQKDIKRLLVEKGLDINYILNIYKELLNREYSKPKASDVLKTLKRLQELHGINKEVLPEAIPEGVRKAVETGKLDAYIIKITAKTQEYVKKLKNKRPKTDNVQEGMVIGSKDRGHPPE